MISVLFICYNRIDFTRKALSNLLLAKSETPFKVYVVDNGSIDGTMEWLLNFTVSSNIRIIFNGENIGPIKVFNQFLDLAVSDGCKRIAKVDNDTIVPDFWLDNLSAMMDAHNLNIIGAKHQTYKESFEVYAKRVAKRVVRKVVFSLLVIICLLVR